MNVTYDVKDSKPVAIQPAHVNFGLAIDMPRPDGTRALVVPNIKAAEEMSFTDFWAAYDDVVKRARDNKLTPADYAGTTVSLTNPAASAPSTRCRACPRARPSSWASVRWSTRPSSRAPRRRP